MGWGVHCQRCVRVGPALGMMEETDGLEEWALLQSTSLAAVTGSWWVQKASLWCSQKVLQWLHWQKAPLSLAGDETQGMYQQSTGDCWQVTFKHVWKELYWAWKDWVFSVFSALIFFIQTARKVDKLFKRPWQLCDTGATTGLRPETDFK